MGAGGVAGLFAVALAAGGGASLGSWAWRQSTTRVESMARLDLPVRERAFALLRSIGQPLRGVAARMLTIGAVQDVVDEALGLLQAERRLDAVTAVSMLLSAAVLVGGVCFLLTLSPVFALAAACICIVGTGLLVRRRADQAAARMRDEVPDALRSLTDSFRSCLLYTSPSPRDGLLSRMPSSA